MGGGAKGKEKDRETGALEQRGEERQREGGAWLTGSWDKMILQAMTVLTIYDPQVAVGDFSNFFNNLLLSNVYFPSYVTQH